MAIDYPNSPSPGDHHTHGGKTWTFHDGKWALNVGVGGVQGPAGVAFQGTAPTTTDVLWADTSVSGVAVVPAGGTTGQMLEKSSSTSYDTAWATPVTSADLALKAPLASPTFTGTPTLPTGTVATTQTAADSTTAIATTAFVTTADNLKANLASPALTGTPTSTTATAGTNNTQIATTAYADAAVAALVDSAPATLNTLDELALALGDDANFASTTATAIGLKAPLVSPSFTTPALGVATATSVNGTTIPTSKTLVVTTDKLSALAATTSAELAGIISDETGSGALVFGTSPTLTTPVLGVATGTSFNSITGLSSTTPVVDGTAAVGVDTTTARGDHVHPTDTSRAATSGTLAQFAATTSSQLASVISDETGFSTGALAVFSISPALTGAPTAPTAAVGTNTTQLATTAFVTTAASNVLGFRNVLINGGFDIWQRATSYSSATSGYLTADRWNINMTTNTVVSQETSDLPAIGVQYGIKYVTSGSGYAQFYQSIEADNIRKYKGQTVTVSAYVKVTSNYVGTLICNIDWSSSTDALSGASTSLAGFSFGNGSNATGWTRFTGTFTVPSNVAGLRVGFIPDTAQGAGVTVRIAGVQLEFGSVASAFESRSYGMELALCQRYYETSNGVHQVVGGSTGFGGNTYFSWTSYKVEKRIALGIVAAISTSNGVKVFATDGGADYITYWKAGTQYYSLSEGFEITTTQGFSMTTGAGGQTDAGLGRFYWFANAEL